MKAIVFDRYGDNSVLRVGEVPVPPVGPRDVLVRVEAASINPVDFKIRSGAMARLGGAQFPQILGNDLAGVVEQVGTEVKRFKTGDAVFARVGKDRIGTFAERVVVEADYTAHRPANLSAVDAASLALVGLTAWQGLVEVLEVQRGQRVLIHAGAGGVGSIAIQLAKHLGAIVATTASGPGIELVRRLGADQVIDYRAERFEDRVRDLDAVYDTLGGESRDRSFGVLKRGGRMVSITGTPTVAFARRQGLGVVPQAVIAVKGLPTWWRAWRHQVEFTFLFMNPSGVQLEQLARLTQDNALTPVVDRTYPLEQAAEALAYVEAGRAKGKVVLTTG